MSEFEKWAKIARENGIYREVFRKRVNDYNWDIELAATLKPGQKKPTEEKDVAIYRGDQFIIWGKVSEVAEKLERTPINIKRICMPSIRKRLEKLEDAYYGIYIDDDEVAK